MRKFLLTIKYNGSDFVGWQVQKNGLSVQTCLQDALQTLFGFRPALTGCSRTDSGVHALGYCAVFSAETDKECRRILTGLNALLPKTVSVSSVREVDGDFHPRYSAKGKEYIYRLYDGTAPDPFLEGLAWHCKTELDTEKMGAAANCLTGKHDFRSFMASGSSITDTVRTIHYFYVRRIEEHGIEIRVCADGFLYNMVRILVGTLVAVGQGKIPPEAVKDILAAVDRSKAGQTAPPYGLYLHRVFYDEIPKEGEYGA